jgi:hypothetical protein
MFWFWNSVETCCHGSGKLTAVTPFSIIPASVSGNVRMSSQTNFKRISVEQMRFDIIACRYDNIISNEALAHLK